MDSKITSKVTLKMSSEEAFWLLGVLSYARAAFQKGSFENIIIKLPSADKLAEFIKTKSSALITVYLTKQEAHSLKALMQNPIFGVDDLFHEKLRAVFWNALPSFEVLPHE